MAERVVLHIGARKTATTYLQRCLQALAKKGRIDPALYPLDTRGEDDHNHVPGLIDLLRTYDQIPLQSDAWRHLDGQAASALIDKVASTPGTVVLSAEAVAATRLAGARTAVAAFAPAEVTVLITTRALGRVLASSWAQHIRNGNIETFSDYLQLRAEEREMTDSLETRSRRAFWRAYSYGSLVRRWQDTGAEVVVATVPASQTEPNLMWERFRVATGLTNELPLEPPRVSSRKANSSLALEQTHVLQGFNVAAKQAGHDRRWIRREHRRLLRHGLAADLDHPLIDGIPTSMHAQIMQWQESDVHDLLATDVDLVGDIDDLRIAPRPTPESAELITHIEDCTGRGLLGIHGLNKQSADAAGQ